MNASQAALAIVYLAVLLTGVAIGLIIAVSVASRREDRYHSLTGEAPDATTKGTRRLIAAGTRRVHNQEELR